MEANPRGLRWQVKTDVAAFQSACENGDWDTALALYGGPLLEGIQGDESAELAAWLELEREHLHAGWRKALLQRAQDLEAEGQCDEAATLLRTLLQRDELDEEALIAYMGAAFRAGQREQALKAHRDFTERLRQELDLEPTSMTQQLAQAIREGNSDALARLCPEPPAPSLQPATSPLPPAPATSFVGRDLELSEIAHLLSRAQCRLLVLVGPGGVGKTRLALQAAHELAGRYKDGVYFVSLEPPCLR